jgi:pimeloyl-ACP methyl ester carboxylesterase
MPFVTAVDGTKLSYEMAGAGPPLLLHLGAGCDAELWRAAGYLEPLASSFTCILFDHRGHGKSDRPEGAVANHVDRLAEDVGTLLDELGFERPAFWGYSNGFTVGLKVADDHPERLGALVMSGVIRRSTPEEIAAFDPEEEAAYWREGWDRLIEEFVQEEGPIPAWMAQRIRETDLRHVIGFGQSWPTWGWDPWEALPRIQNPTLIVAGELEDPDDSMAEAAARMQDGRRIRVPGKGHINGFLDSAFVLPHAIAFLTANAGPSD